MMWVVQAGSIYENDLSIVLSEDAKLLVACGLRQWRDGRNLLTDDGIDEC